MKKKIVVVRQEEIKDCGAASLLSIIKYYGGNISLQKLREMTKTTKNGSTAFHLIECAKQLGFSSKGIECSSINDLKSKIDTPFIAHLIINKSYKHYVVVYNLDFKKNIITIMDPNIGIKKLSFDEFEKSWSKIIITFIPIKKIINLKTSNTIKKLIKNFICSNKKLVVNLFLLSLFTTIFSIIGSYYFKILIDNFVINSLNNFYIISFIFLIITILKIISDFFRNQILIYINEKIDFELMISSFKHIICLPYDYFKSKTTGEILSRINDLNYIKEMISKVSLTLFVDIVLVLGSSIILFSINNTLFLISTIIFILYFITVIFFSPIFKNLILDNQQNQAKVNSFLVESLNNYESIKSMGNENKIINSLENKYSKFITKVLKMNKTSNIQILIKDLIGGIGLIIILFVGYLLVIDNKMTFGDLITYNSLLIYFLEPIKSILELEPLVRYSISSLKRINELFEIEEEFLGIDKKYTGNKIKGNILINNLSYSLNDKDYILNKINFKVNKGEKVLLIGKSGSGKSTLVKLLLNYSKVKRNQILIDNKDINDYNTKELRNNITYVSQNETLFTDSIYENIVQANKVDYEKFLEICNFTEVDQIIKNKPLGYDTLLEENGFNISGGEKNRIILSRALTNDFSILILDEALNELDINMERRILKRLFKKYKDKTMIIISHRLENMDLFDKVVKMKNGNVIKRMN
ncbi:MAG: peptidase domain-containing ABC transporter [Bacilli bacterium]|nr:peptidase domain-containing ABC transporter [Bacilli bacterium]